LHFLKNNKGVGMKIEERIKGILEEVIREEIHEEFDVPIISPPNNRVTDFICKKVFSESAQTFSERIGN